MENAFTGPSEPEQITVTFSGAARVHGDTYTLRARVDDSTDAEACEVECHVSGSTATIFSPLDTQAIADTLAHYLNLWPAEYRLALVRARAESGGSYLIGGNPDLGLTVSEPPIQVAA